MTTIYGVWCHVSGGVTGTREAWLKRYPSDDSKPHEFATFEEAEAEARRLRELTSRAAITLTYTARPLPKEAPASRADEPRTCRNCGAEFGTHEWTDHCE
jgi:hypothetical protein